MELTTTQDGSIRVLKSSGRLDQASAETFQKSLIPHLSECGPDGISLILDFSGVDYVSSVGLRVLILAAKQVKAQNGKIVITELTPVVAEVFQIGRFHLVLKTFKSYADAVAFLTQ